MSSYIRGPVYVIVGLLLAICITIVALPYLAGASPFDSASSNALVSTATAYTDLLVFFAIFIAGGMVLIGLGRVKR